MEYNLVVSYLGVQVTGTGGLRWKTKYFGSPQKNIFYDSSIWIYMIMI